MTKYSAHLPLSRRGILVGATSLLLLAGCSGLIGPSGPPPQIYVLEPNLHALGDAPSVSWQLAVGTPDASESLDATRIALHRGGMMDYYADARWTDTVPVLLQANIVRAFEKSGKIQAVAATSDAVRADYVLKSTLHDFQANYDGPNGAPTIVVDMMVRIIKVGHSDVVATATSGRRLPRPETMFLALWWRSIRRAEPRLRPSPHGHCRRRAPRKRRPLRLSSECLRVDTKLQVELNTNSRYNLHES